MIIIMYLSFGPYHTARINAFARKENGKVMALQVYGSDKKYLWENGLNEITECECMTLFPGKAEDMPFDIVANKLIKVLTLSNPKCVIFAGYSEPILRVAANFCFSNKIPTIMLMVSTYQDNKRNFFWELFKSYIFSKYSAVAAVGARSEQYAVRLGVPLNRIFRIGNVVDNVEYSVDLIPIENRNDILIVARLSPEKNIEFALKVFKQYRARGGRLNLKICGDGPLKSKLVGSMEEYSDCISFMGWLNGHELINCYANAKCVYLPSISEPWGLVINEAMASGCIPIASNRCGCVPELIRCNWSGFVVSPYDIEENVETLLSVDRLRGDQLQEFSDRNLSIISTFTPDTWASSLVSCVKAITGI